MGYAGHVNRGRHIPSHPADASTGILVRPSGGAAPQAQQLAGAGLVQLHTYMAEPHLRSGALVQVLDAYAVDGPPISVLFPSNQQLSPKVRAFIEFVSETLAK